MPLGIRDRRVIDAFTDRKALEGHKLSTDGERLDGHWLGGRRLAYWSEDGIELPETGGRIGDSIQRAVRRSAAPADMADYRPSKKLYAGVSYGSRPRDPKARRSRIRSRRR